MLPGMVRRISTSVPVVRRFRVGGILFRRPVLGETRMLCTRDLCGSEYRNQFLHALDHDGWWRASASLRVRHLRARHFLAWILAPARLSTATRLVESPRLRVRIPPGRSVESDARDLTLAESDAHGLRVRCPCALCRHGSLSHARSK